MKLLSITQGRFSQVDDEDFDYLSQFNWNAQKDKTTYYVTRNVYLGKNKHTTELMHRIIIKATEGMVVDHIDHDGLNNQKSNLRVCTRYENIRNRKVTTNPTSSKFLGVNIKQTKYKEKVYVGYVARIRNIYIGSFPSEIEAAKAYNEKAKELFGEFANLNKV